MKPYYSLTKHNSSETFNSFTVFKRITLMTKADPSPAKYQQPMKHNVS